MRLYLDTSVLNRPFDNQRQPRIWLETLAFSLVLSLVETGEAELISSPIHTLENSRSPLAVRRLWVDRCLRLASHTVTLTDAIRTRAQELAVSGQKPLDALHLACAEAAKADCFLTCDDRLIKRYIGPLTLQTPPNFIANLPP
ncbi:MAG: PIN domain-containing protein [Chthoniobacter sp.]|nr:PIN domain-containing protein [Chthoniobacter sp.]